MSTRLDKLTFETADVVFDSWDAVKKIPDYDVVVGEMMFRKIFEIAPSTLKIFSFGKSYVGREESLYNSATFEIHAKAMIKMLEDVLSMIMPDLVPMKKTLKSLGARHITYGVLPQHYGYATEALLSSLESLLGDKWTPQVEEGWKSAFGFITKTMIVGANKVLKKRREQRKLSEISLKMEEPPEEEEPMPKISTMESRKVSFQMKEDCCKKGKDSEKDSDDTTMSTIGSDSMLDYWEESDINYMKLVEDVYDSWDTIKKTPNYSEVTGTLLFQNIFEASPKAQELFQFAKGYQENDDALFTDIGFLIHAKSVVKMLDACIGMMGPDMEPVTRALEDLGARHHQYNVIDVHYVVVGQALLKTLETALGDAWTPKLQESWTGVYAFMSNAMQKGARDCLDVQLEM